LTLSTNRLVVFKKSLKIPKGYSESVNKRRTDTTMATEKDTKEKQRSTKHYIEKQRSNNTNPN